jgi:hypothetical protein
MKKQVLERIAKLLTTNNQDVRRKLQGELYHFITSAKLPFENPETELKTKNLIINDITEFVKNQNPITINNLKIQLAFIGELFTEE